MENLIKTLLLEGIDEATIHKVLDIIEEDAKDEAMSRLSREYDKEAEEIPNRSKEMYELNNKYKKLRKKVDKHFNKNKVVESLVSVVEELTHSNISEEALDEVLTEIFSTVSEEEIDEVANLFIQSSVIEMIPEHAEEINELFGLGKAKPYMKPQPSAMDKLKQAASKVLGNVKAGFSKAKAAGAEKVEQAKAAVKAGAEKAKEAGARAVVKAKEVAGKAIEGAKEAGKKAVSAVAPKPSAHDQAMSIIKSRYNKPLPGVENKVVSTEAPKDNFTAVHDKKGDVVKQEEPKKLEFYSKHSVEEPKKEVKQEAPKKKVTKKAKEVAPAEPAAPKKRGRKPKVAANESVDKLETFREIAEEILSK